MKAINIYTDGACSGNQNAENIGGFGAILEYGKYRKELHGGEINTTNNRMEMLALISAFRALTKENQTIHVFSDSSYLMNCFREKWYEGWIKNGWKTAKKTPVENKDLWESLLEFIPRHTIHFYRVKGHVNLKSANTKIQPLYDKFCQWNGPTFSLEDFLYVTEMNNLADRLANQGMDEIRQKATSPLR
ncbi:MAG: ribonuclease HI [Anaerovorax sp.]